MRMRIALFFCFIANSIVCSDSQDQVRDKSPILVVPVLYEYASLMQDHKGLEENTIDLKSPQENLSCFHEQNKNPQEENPEQNNSSGDENLLGFAVYRPADEK